MRIRSGCMFIFLSCFVTIARAQDQTVVIAQPPRVCPSVGSVATAQLNPADAAILITNTLGTAPADDTYYIIHDLRYNDGQFTIDQQHWYVYYPGWIGRGELDRILDPRIDKHFEEARIYGSRKVGLVYIHTNIPGTTEATAITRATAAIVPVPPATSLSIASDLITRKLIGSDPAASNRELTDSVTGHKLTGIGGGVVDEAFKDLQSLTYRVAITKKLPAPVQNLQAIAGVISPSAQAGANTVSIQIDTVNVCGGKVFDVSALPSDMTATALAGSGSNQKELTKNTFDNEKKYWYDFSFALPLKSFNDLTVNSTDLTLMAKKVEKQNLFAMVNLSPIPYDTKKAQFQLIPVFLYGVPITGKPLNHHLLAGAIGLNRIQFFAGIMLDHNRTLAAPLPPGTSNGSSSGTGPVIDKWNSHLSYGINFPVSTVVSLLKSSKK